MATDKKKDRGQRGPRVTTSIPLRDVYPLPSHNPTPFLHFESQSIMQQKAKRNLRQRIHRHAASFKDIFVDELKKFDAVEEREQFVKHLFIEKDVSLVYPNAYKWPTYMYICQQIQSWISSSIHPICSSTEGRIALSAIGIAMAPDSPSENMQRKISDSMKIDRDTLSTYTSMRNNKMLYIEQRKTLEMVFPLPYPSLRATRKDSTPIFRQGSVWLLVI